MIGLTVIGLILGGLAGYFGGKFIEDYGVQIVGFVAAFIGVLLLTTTISGIPPIGKMAAAFLGGLLGFYFANQIRRYVLSIGTAIIGSGMFVFGLDQYIPGLPDVLPKNGAQITQLSPATFGYLAGFVILVCLGSFI